MANLGNLTPFAIRDFPSVTKEGDEVLVVVVAGRFDLPGKGKSRPDFLAVSEEQVAPHAAEVYWGEPGKSSLRYEVQNAYARPGTDIYLNGHARPPRGRPVTELVVRIQAAGLVKEALVSGDRVWQGALLGAVPSAPKPFDAMPLIYERSFGGNLPSDGSRRAVWEPRNPVGCGLYRDATEADGKPLPNLEDPKRRIAFLSSRPPPVGFGPIQRGWEPRRPFGGTYDEKWVEERAPLWPMDLDERFFQAASPGLVATPRLKGGEPVQIEGVSPDGPVCFHVPQRRIILKTTFRHRVDRRMMLLDGLLIEPDERAVTLIWRATVPVERAMQYHRFSVARELEPWENESQ